MRLPAPNEFGTYVLPDGSRIYPSGSKSIAVKPGKYFVWLKTGETFEGTGKRKVSVGRILLARDGPLYFDDPERAMHMIEDLKIGSASAG